MHVTPAFHVNVSFSRSELRIVGLALAGRLVEKADLAEAAELNLRLLEHRKRLLQEELVLVEGALGKLT